MYRILVIEDEPAVRENIVDLLATEGFYPIQAQSGEEGVRLAWEWKPDLIICDIRMPDLDGYGILAKLRLEPITASIPFIFLTALSSRDDIRRGMQLGADDFITKPFDLTDLLTAVEVRLQKKHTLFQSAQRHSAEMATRLDASFPREVLAGLAHISQLSRDLFHHAVDQQDEVVQRTAQEVEKTSNRLAHLAQSYLFLSDLEQLMLDESRVSQQLKAFSPDAHAQIDEISRANAHLLGFSVVLHLQPAHLRMANDHLVRIVDEVLTSLCGYCPKPLSVEITGQAAQAKGLYALQFSLQPPDPAAEAGQNFEESVLAIGAASGQLRQGLGLVIVERLVSLYGGELKIAAEQGRIIRVSMVLPLANGFRPKV